MSLSAVFGDSYCSNYPVVWLVLSDKELEVGSILFAFLPNSLPNSKWQAGKQHLQTQKSFRRGPVAHQEPYYMSPSPKGASEQGDPENSLLSRDLKSGFNVTCQWCFGRIPLFGSPSGGQ